MCVCMTLLLINQEKILHHLYKNVIWIPDFFFFFFNGHNDSTQNSIFILLYIRYLPFFMATYQQFYTIKISIFNTLHVYLCFLSNNLESAEQRKLMILV